MVVQDRIQTDLVDSPLKNDKKHRLKQRFDVQRKLGQGTYGKVQLAVNRETGQEVAVKTIKKVKIESEQDLIRIRREIQIMSSIQHPHIIHIYEVFENKDKIVLVMQFASGGELYDYLSEKKVLSDLEARRIFRQIAAAVYYCHKNKICHRDLKLENILLDERGNAKIADFGLSNVFDEKHLLKTYCGSPLYASPEIVKGVPYCGPEVDCWSMGVLLYTLVYGAMPFDGSNFKKLVTQISEGDYFEPKKKSNATELIHRLLTVNPEKRATIVDICMDYWVNLGYEHSLLQVAEDMANLTPVRLDLLLALAPGSPIPDTGDSEFQEESDADPQAQDQISEKDTPDDDEEDEEYNTDTAANSFAYMKGSRSSQHSLSSPNLQDAVDGAYEDDDDENEFLPADIAAELQGETSKRLAERSFGSSLARISSLAHRSKKPRKSDSTEPVKENNEQPCKKMQTNEIKKEVNKSADEIKISTNKQNSDLNINKESTGKSRSFDKMKDFPVNNPVEQNITASKSEEKVSTENVTTMNKSATSFQKQKSEDEPPKATFRKDSLTGSKVLETACLLQKRGSITAQDDKTEAKKVGRPPGKIIIPRTFDSPQSTPSPKITNEKKLLTSDETQNVQQNGKNAAKLDQAEATDKQRESVFQPPVEDINKNVVPNSDSSAASQTSVITEEKKNMAKGILKKGIAKAKLAERKMSQQSSIDSDISTPPVSLGTPEPGPSFFKVPKPYEKEEVKTVESKAEIKLSSAKSSASTLKSETVGSRDAPLWEAAYSNKRQLQDKNRNWSAISSTIDSEMSGWREQMEESLRRLSPEDERPGHSLSKTCDDKPLVPIARSYKKFTFTKDGACITETKKIYTTPGTDGSWTKVEKKTKITTRPGNAEEFEKFRDLHLRNDSPLTRSDSQSSSGSNDKYDDIFDSWTGDTMMCNMRKMNNMFQKFSQDPFLRKERRRNPFRFFRRADSERNEREKRKYEIRNGRSTDRESSENEDDVHFDDSSAVVYGSQGLWQLLRSANRGLPGRVTIHQEPASYSRSVSQDRSESKFGTNWKRCGSRASSGYNTATRSQSRDRTESPREKVLRFVFESPTEEFASDHDVKASPSRQEKWSIKRNISRQNPRRDSGVGSDGYESEYSVRQCPSDELSKTGRVSSMSSVHSGARQDMIRNFMKSWSKEFSSPPLSPTSLGNAKEQLENLSENRKTRVEQWLHMNDYPFNMYDESQSKGSARKSNASHSSNSTAYATMRPREYRMYNRSSSDKLADYDVNYFPSFEESHRGRSIHSINKDLSPSEANKMRFRTPAYSPVSEESKESRSTHHSDSSGSSVHHINFTISDGRITSSHNPPQPATQYMKSYTTSKEGQVPSKASPSNVKFEQVSTRNPGQPVVQMRVSFNRGNRENQVIHVASQSPPTSVGLWEQHSTPLSLRQDFSPPPPREVSPLPGIRTFSTEVAHCVGGTERPARTSVECDITTSGKESPRCPGKNSPYNPSSPCNGIWNLACPQTCMENGFEATNINTNAQVLPSESPNFSPSHSNNLKHYLPLKSDCDSTQEQTSTSISNGANTPDSLEDLSFEQSLPHYANNDQNDLIGFNDQTGAYDESSCGVTSSNEFQLEIKPLGVLWNNCNMKAQPTENKQGHVVQLENGEFVAYTQLQNPSTPDDFSDDSESLDLQQKCIENTSPEVGSIWEQKNASRTFDLLKNLLCDDGLDSFSSSKCILESSETKQLKNCIDVTRNNANSVPLVKSPVIERHMSVIDDIELGRINRDNYNGKMPSLMDDLQSPKEVLRQAMKICESFEH